MPNRKIFSLMLPTSPTLSPKIPGQQPRLSRFYHPELDVLRFLAFLTVFFRHTLPTQPEVYINHHIPAGLASIAAIIASTCDKGVVLFFVLSSYLITKLLLLEKEKTGKIALKEFYIRRALRIWPLYFVFVVLTIWVFPLLGYDHVGIKNGIGLFTFTANWTIPLSPQVASPGMLLWSVSVEEQFYLLWPLALVCFGIGSLKRIGVVLIALALGFRLWVLPRGWSQNDIWLSTFSHLDSIAAGALLAYQFRDGIPSLTSRIRISLFAAGVTLPVAAAIMGNNRVWGHLIMYPAATIGSCAVLVSILGIKLPSGRTSDALIYLGKVSYGLYVFHGFAVWTVAVPGVSLTTVLVLALAMTIALAAISYQWLERPFLRLKDRFARVASRSA